jgi:predicted O-methyltransferase YrrM
MKRMHYLPLDANNSIEGLQQMIDEIVKPDFTIIEIGSFAGVSSELFARACKKLICVDLWDIPDPDYKEMTQAKKVKAFSMFKKVAAKYPNIQMMKGFSKDIARIIPIHSVDIVYIDANHDKLHAIEDIGIWKSKVKNGGYITGHDINFPEVLESVKFYFGDYFKTYPDMSWMVKKK